MNRSKIVSLCVLIIFLLLSVFPFRSYFFSQKVPLPFNLLVFYYSPWKDETEAGYGLHVPNKPLGFDNLKLFYPLKKFTVDQMKSGNIPLWNPFVFSGNVHLATYQSAVFYPLNFLYFLLPMADAWSLLVIVLPILSGWFMYLFLTSLGLSPKSSLFGAIGFAFSGWMIAMWEEVLVLEHSIIWLPLALYGSNMIWSGKLSRGSFLVVVSLVFSILAGFLQMSIYLFLAVIAWNIYQFFSRQNRTDKHKITLVLLINFLLSILLSAIQWVPALEVYLLSPRGTVDAANLFQMFLSPFSHLITFLVPDFWGSPGSYNYFSKLRYIQERTIYVGIFILILASFALVKKIKGNINFWKIFTVLTLSLGFTLPTSWVWYVLRIPILSVAQPARIFSLSMFGICVLASFGLNEWKLVKDRKLLIKILTFYSVSIILLWLFVSVMKIISVSPNRISFFCSKRILVSIMPFLCEFKQITAYATISLRNLILPSVSVILAWAIFLIFSKRKNFFYVCILTTTILGGLYFANKMLYFSDRKYEFPEVEPISELKKISGFDRVWSVGDAYIMRNILSYFGLYSPEGYDALFSGRYGELINTIKSWGITTDKINRTDVDLSEVGPNESLEKNQFRLRLMSIFDVKYILDLKTQDETMEENRFPKKLFTVAWENNRWRIWQYRQALPRAFFASQYIVETDKQRIADALFHPSFDPGKTLILEEKVREGDVGSFSNNGRVAMLSYEPEKIIMQTDNPENGLLFLSDNYFPGWNAYIDGKRTKIYRADYSFRAIFVPSGRHTVRYEYAPDSFKLAVILGVFGVIGLVSLLVCLSRCDKSK